ncbi:MAG: primosomal protein N' [Oscillospiraceae bacterium]|nr:primosomal protein N' [Oscillospiraceae bacterium]
MFARIAVSAANYSIDKPYDYRIPEQLEGKAGPGTRVFVPFGKGNRVSEGVVLSVAETSDYPNCKELIRTAEAEPLLTQEQLRLALFMRERYFCTVYEAVRSMLPAGYWFDKTGRQRSRDKTREMLRLAVPAEEAAQYAETKLLRAPKQAEVLELLASFEVLSVQDVMQHTGAGRPVLKRLAELGLVELYQQEVLRRPELSDTERQPIPLLNREQREVLHAIREERKGMQAGAVSLLAGVTGSGKTSVYAHLISETLEEGHGVILLVPEISLTPQTLSLFSSWFGDRVAILHSGLSSGERYDEWKRIKRGDAKLVIGTRSAVFAPVADLGLVIIDEEQEDSYASESVPRYQACEIARFRCIQSGAFLLLGSATPDIGSRYLAQQREYGYHRLNHRYNEQPLPAVHIVDMKQELLQGNSSSLSKSLRDAILERIERNEQSILFLNRRGTNKLVTCGTCGYIYRCPHCSVSMTWHANRRRMICHYCGTSRYLDSRCPDCGGMLNFFGAGTQMVEDELKETFPGVGILRVDADSVSPVGSHQVLFQRFVEEKIPLMVGTQMIAKGLNFDNVTLVGVISADQGLYSNDYRAGEKTFSLLTQVIGRCGRSTKPGEAYIQTYTPDNEIIRLAAQQDYESFYEAEIEMRRMQKAPPFENWVGLTATGVREDQLLHALKKCRAQLESVFAAEGETVEILGPIPMAVVKVSDRYRYRLQLRCKLNKNIRRILASTLISCSQDPEMKKLSFYVENDASS